MQKLSLPTTILLASLILGGFLFASQIAKQHSIEKQQEIQLNEDRRINELKIEQTKKEYIVKRKNDCYSIENSERKKFNNVHGSYYDEERDVCNVSYENEKWRENDPQSCGFLEKPWDKDSKCTIEHYFSNEF